MRNVKSISLLGISAAIASAFIYVGCGSSATNLSLSVGPLSGIFSPTTGTDSRRRGSAFKAASVADGFSLFGASTGCGDGKGLEEQITDLKSAADPANLAATATSLAKFSNPGSFRPSCYGPTWTDNARGSSVDRPSGDLGIVFEKASTTDNTACVACQVNALISSGPGLGNRLIKVVAMGVAALGEAGKTLPAAGAEEDILATGKLPAVDEITFTAFKLKRLDDRDGHAIYLTTFAFTDKAGKSGDITLYHEQLTADNSEFQGLLYGTLPHTETTPSGAGDKRGISFVYHSQSNIYKFSFKTGANRGSSSADFFDATTHTIDFSKAANGEDMHYILGYFDSANFGGTLHYAWQAGNGDGATRTFAVDVPNAAKGSRTGTGFAGYGGAMSTIAATGVPWTTKFHCDWLNGGGGGTSVTKVQKQVMADTTGDFVASSSLINYAPVPSCNNASWTVSSAEASFLDGVKATAATDMVTPPVAGDFTYNFATAGNEPTFTVP